MILCAKEGKGPQAWGDVCGVFRNSGQAREAGVW